MKHQGIYPGILLLSIGGYYFITYFPFPFSEQLIAWPSLFLLLGVGLFLQAYAKKDYSFLLPGGVTLGLGIHFHGLSLVENWPSHWSVFTFILGCSYLIHYGKTKKEGLLLGIILVITSSLVFTTLNPFLYFQKLSSFLSNVWPLLFIILGLYLLVKHK